ncbi:ImmA/IrrE family metallo-endopeptidase [Szabonella alba]|uniref:ImmA/IrrE family metallo-endopeptidase n=2 Tax=Paracoccaceae TaxID=31989 RepID=A0A8K0VE36_9RHOB|nr:ImmA/IrrE family metallo-endopeptidase [Szabonella alba]MBL4917999.1 ImmA/IrrE family metallo-endopeptidase [Szabonella alba]
MQRPDDCSLSPSQLARVRGEAERALREAGALGVFPTPVEAIMTVAKVEEVKEDVLSPKFIDKLRSGAEQAGGALKRAVGKVMGLFHASAGLVYLDQTMMAVKKRFVRLHESGHGFMPWQRPMYALVEDCANALEPDAAELFDREANVFAAEVLFQLDSFRDMAEGEKFSIWTPVRLAKKFDASIYACVRQYVSKNHRACAVVVLNMPEFVEGDGFRATLRRPVQSDSFTTIFGAHDWKPVYTPDDDIGALIPISGQRSSGQKSLVLLDRNGDRHECVAESFTQTHQVFVLIHVIKTLAAPRPIFLTAV